jgi:EAL domain-containing protein (putative c-di-GMP-specific phosphodiesterase class I)/GGDEF domain-containing protein
MLLSRFFSSVDLPARAAETAGSGYAQDFAVALAATAREGGTLLLTGIDNIAMLISGHGVAAAEHAMTSLQAIIRAELPKSSRLMRVQRDQYAALLPRMDEAAQEALCTHIDAVIRRFSPQSDSGLLYFMAKSVCVPCDNPSAPPFQYLARAVAGLIDAEEGLTGDGEKPDNVSIESRRHMEGANMLTLAMEEKRFRLAYQPVIDSKTGRIAHYEALLRLHSHDGKISSAGILIPIAERMGMVHLLDEFTLDRVVQELRYDPQVVLALNVSNETIRTPSWIKRFRHHLKETPEIGPRMICEITETAVHRDLKQSAMFCAEIQETGAEIALDDFGSGYTSFRQLKTLSIDMVKIDGSFVKDLTDNTDNRFFVKTMLDFTQGFGLKSAAEYVENGETAKMLMELGVDLLQGYYFGRPENIRRWLQEGEYSRG